MLSHPTHYLPSFPSALPGARTAWQGAVTEHQARGCGSGWGKWSSMHRGHCRERRCLLRNWGSPLSPALPFHPLRLHLPVPILALTRPQEAAQPHQRLCYLHKPHSSSLLLGSSPAQGHFPLIAVQWEGGWCQEVQTIRKVTRAAVWASPKITQTQPCFISAAQKD